MSDQPTIYLAGPVANVADGGAGWRDDLVDAYGEVYDFRNPLDKYNVPVDGLTVVAGDSYDDNPETVGVTEIVEGDKDLLRESDGVLVGYTPVRSIGTPMEVMWARERDYPVVLWDRDEVGDDAISPWYRYHWTAYTTAAGMGLRHIERQAPDVETRPIEEVSIDA